MDGCMDGWMDGKTHTHLQCPLLAQGTTACIAFQSKPTAFLTPGKQSMEEKHPPLTWSKAERQESTGFRRAGWRGARRVWGSQPSPWKPAKRRNFLDILGFLKPNEAKSCSCSLCTFQAVVQVFVHASHKAQQWPAHVCQLSGNTSISQYRLASFSVNVSKH